MKKKYIVQDMFGRYLNITWNWKGSGEPYYSWVEGLREAVIISKDEVKKFLEQDNIGQDYILHTVINS